MTDKEWTKLSRGTCCCCGKVRVLYTKPYSTQVCRACTVQLDAGCTSNCIPAIGAHDSKCARGGAEQRPG